MRNTEKYWFAPETVKYRDITKNNALLKKISLNILWSDTSCYKWSFEQYWKVSKQLILLVNIDISTETPTLMVSVIRYRSGIKLWKTDKKKKALSSSSDTARSVVTYFVNLLIRCLFAVFVRRWKIHFNPCFRFSGAGQNAFHKFGKLRIDFCIFKRLFRHKWQLLSQILRLQLSTLSDWVPSSAVRRTKTHNAFDARKQVLTDASVIFPLHKTQPIVFVCYAYF